MMRENLSSIRNDYLMLNSLTSDYLLTFSDRAKQQWEIKETTIKKKIDSLPQRALSPTQALFLLQKHQQFVELFSHLTTLVSEEKNVSTGSREISVLKNELSAHLLFASREITENVNKLAQQQDVTHQNIHRKSEIFSMLFFLFFPLLVFLILYWVNRNILSPLISLKTGTEEIAKGKYQVELGIHSNDEVGALANSFMKMGNAVKTKIDELSKSEERFREIFNATSEAIFIYDIDTGNISDINQSMLDMYGYSYEEARRFTIGELGSGKSPYTEQDVLEKVQQAIEEGPQFFELHACRKDGGLFWVEVTLKRTEIAAKGRLLVVVRNITERKQIEKQLLQTQRMESVGTLAGGIAHDFNNILSGILGYAELAQLDGATPEKLKKYLEEILNAAHRARDLVKQILAFSRKNELQLKPIQIQLIVKETLKLLRSSIPTTIEIKQDIDPNCQAVLADPTQIHQIVMNLCTNAYQSMRNTGGILGVSLQPIELLSDQVDQNINLQPNLYVKLEISDTGTGMSREVMDRIFDPYYTTKGHGEGTGLGLAVVHGIVIGLNGDISVHSEPGQGTTFKVYLPTVAAPAITIHDDDEVTALPAGGGERILFVDDDERIVDINKNLLAQLGYTVTALTSSIDALKVFQDNPNDFDLVITDMTMPKMTGEELIRKIFNVRPEMPIIMCTGYSELIDEEKAKILGIKSYIMKPVSQQNIAKTIRKVLDDNL